MDNLAFPWTWDEYKRAKVLAYTIANGLIKPDKE